MTMIAEVAIDSTSGDNCPANQIEHDERYDTHAMRKLQEAAKRLLEQDGPDQEQ